MPTSEHYTVYPTKEDDGYRSKIQDLVEATQPENNGTSVDTEQIVKRDTRPLDYK